MTVDGKKPDDPVPVPVGRGHGGKKAVALGRTKPDPVRDRPYVLPTPESEGRGYTYDGVQPPEAVGQAYPDPVKVKPVPVGRGKPDPVGKTQPHKPPESVRVGKTVVELGYGMPLLLSGMGWRGLDRAGGGEGGPRGNGKLKLNRGSARMRMRFGRRVIRSVERYIVAALAPGQYADVRYWGDS